MSIVYIRAFTDFKPEDMASVVEKVMLEKSKEPSNRDLLFSKEPIQSSKKKSVSISKPTLQRNFNSNVNPENIKNSRKLENMRSALFAKSSKITATKKDESKKSLIDQEKVRINI